MLLFLAIISLIAVNASNFCVKCDKHPADCSVIFYGSEVVSVLKFVVGACALRG